MSAARAATPALWSLGVAAICATLCYVAAPAGANPVQDLQQEAASLSQQMLLEQLQVDGFEQQRAADMTTVAADDTQLRGLQTQLIATRNRIDEDLARLRSAAVTAYVEGGTGVDGVSALFAASPSDGASGVYAEVMTGDLTSSVARLQADRRLLDTEEAAQQQVAAEEQRQLRGADAALNSAESTEQALSQQRAGVTSQLAAVMAQEQAQEEQAQRQRVQQEEAQAQQPQAQAQATQAPLEQAPLEQPQQTVAHQAAATDSASVATSTASTSALPQLNSFLTCVVQAESSGDYQAVSPTGQYMGAFQFAQSTWNEAAQLAGLPTLVGVPPTEASPRDQDLLAIALYNADGEQPWYDPCTE